ncbi:hypothetical protein [Thermus filiformis]|uniref:Uncharacterized protein n=1 Tax=Thermus filiformis TaxID=276 RepID=A0A0A2WQT5_THEFI|nr:hypothetical protein [Thermus filiformis]KGQ22536.1 hypothetical protein THFILI_02145 [Thermus filiformis]
MRRVWLPLLLGLALAQAGFEQLAALLSFGPYEPVRQQANAACAQAGDNLPACLQQMAASLCMGQRDPMVYVWCSAAASAPYPLRSGERSLPLRPYRVEIVGGYVRERDPQTNRVLRERPIPPSTLYTATPQGNGFLVEETIGGTPFRYFADPYWVIYTPQGTPLTDGLNPSPLFLGKPYLVFMVPPPQQGFPPSASLYKVGRLADDFDGDGVAELGYLTVGGSAGQRFTSGSVHAIAYDPNTLVLKYQYLLFANQSDENPYLNFVQERLIRYQVR